VSASEGGADRRAAGPHFSQTELGAMMSAVGHFSFGRGLSRWMPFFIRPEARCSLLQRTLRLWSACRSPLKPMMAERKAMTWIVLPSLSE
jgi:hypothetical protein